MRISSAAYLLKQGIRNVWNNGILSFALFCILTISMLMFGFTVIVSANISSMISDIETKNEVIIFLTDDADDAYIEELGEKLKSTPNVSQVTFYSKEEAFSDIKKDMADAEDIFSYLGEESPLPDAYRIRITDISEMSSTLMAINSFKHIEKVKAPYDFVNVLTGLKTITTVLSVCILIALIIVSSVMIINCTRASVDARKKEIYIQRYVGATSTFIKIPFFIEGITIGIFAGVLATVLTWLIYDGVTELLSTETTLIAAIGTGGFIPAERFIWYVAAAYVIAGAVICSFGTVISMRKHAKI